MKLVQEFKEFAMRGNVVDLAVGVIMGAAFGKIVTSLVADILMPPIGYLVGGIKFTDLKVTLPQFTKSTIKVPDPANPGAFIDKALDAVSINYGNFLQATFDFVIVAVCIFSLVKVMNSLTKKAEEAPPKLNEEVMLLTEIRDLLKSKAT